jgi:hypothetical protein
LNEHWFVSMRHAKSLIEEWRIEYNLCHRLGFQVIDTTDTSLQIRRTLASHRPPFGRRTNQR